MSPVQTAIPAPPAFPKRLRVVLLLQDLAFGGTQRHALELGARLDPQHFYIELWTLITGDDFLPQAQAYGLPIRRLSDSAVVGPRALLALWQALRRERPDVLVPLTVVPNIWGRLLGRLAGVGTIIGNCRGAADCALQHEWLLWPLADHVLCNAEALRHRLHRTFRVPAHRISVIRNGVNVETFAPSATPPAGPPVIVCVARLAPVKDHRTLLDAFDKLAAGHADVQLWLIGDGPSRDTVTARIRQSPFHDRITHVPGATDLRPYYARASLLVLSSRHEGLPNVVLEGMASGLPVVATNVGGLPELVEDHVTGRLVPAGASEALALALRDILDDPQRRTAMGAAARCRALALFSLEAMAEQHVATFARIMDKRRHAP